MASSINVSTIWASGTVLITSPLTKICPLPLPESQIVETLIEEAMRIAEEMGEPIDEESAGAPSVTVG